MSVLLSSMSGAFHAAVGPCVSGTWLRSVPLCTDSECMTEASLELLGSPGLEGGLCGCGCVVEFRPHLASLHFFSTKQRRMMSEDPKG